MFGDRPYPHEVVLLLTVGFLVDILLFFLFFFVVFIIVTSHLGRILQEQLLGLLVLAVLKMTIQLRRLVILPMGWASVETPLRCSPEQPCSPHEGEGDPPGLPRLPLGRREPVVVEGCSWC
jgi:hypothetical protein